MKRAALTTGATLWAWFATVVFRQKTLYQKRPLRIEKVRYPDVVYGQLTNDLGVRHSLERVFSREEFQNDHAEPPPVAERNFQVQRTNLDFPM